MNFLNKFFSSESYCIFLPKKELCSKKYNRKKYSTNYLCKNCGLNLIENKKKDC